MCIIIKIDIWKKVYCFDIYMSTSEDAFYTTVTLR